MQILNLEVALTRIHVILTHAVRENTVFLLGKCAFPCFISHAHSFNVVSSCLLWLVTLCYKFLYVLCKVGKWRYFRSWNSQTEDTGSHGRFCLVEREWKNQICVHWKFDIWRYPEIFVTNCTNHLINKLWLTCCDSK